MTEKKDVRIGTNNIQVTIFISITIFCLSCAKTWPRRMWRRRSRRTSRWTRMLPSWKVRGGQGSKWGWYQIRTLHTIQIKWSNMLVGECAIMSIKHRPYKWTTSFHRERLRFLLWIFKWPHDQLNATKLVRVVCKTQKLKDKTYILREFELMVRTGTSGFNVNISWKVTRLQLYTIWLRKTLNCWLTADKSFGNHTVLEKNTISVMRFFNWKITS